MAPETVDHCKSIAWPRVAQGPGLVPPAPTTWSRAPLGYSLRPVIPIARSSHMRLAWAIPYAYGHWPGGCNPKRPRPIPPGPLCRLRAGITGNFRQCTETHPISTGIGQAAASAARLCVCCTCVQKHSAIDIQSPCCVLRFAAAAAAENTGIRCDTM